MDNHEIEALGELLTKEKTSKLSPKEKAKLKALQRKVKADEKKTTPQDATPKGNVFATKPTTKITPLPIRFSGSERAGLRTLSDDLKAQHMEKIIKELGGEREINETKLIRAAVLLLKERSPDEIIGAIKEVKLNMIR